MAHTHMLLCSALSAVPLVKKSFGGRKLTFCQSFANFCL